MNTISDSISAPTARVLFVDDDSTNLIIDKQYMKKSNIQADTAKSGAECIELMKSFNDYDILFMDLMMPGMSGIETLRKLIDEGLVLERTAKIILTASDNADIIEKYQELGFDAYLFKPFDKSKMLKILTDYIPSEKIENAPSGNSDTVSSSGLSNYEFKEDELVNEKEGLSFNDGDEEMYETMRGSFIDFGFDKKFMAAFKENNWEAYCNTAHTLKLFALKVGSKPLSEAAVNIEKMINSGNTQWALDNHRYFMRLLYRTMKIVNEMGT